MTCRGSGIRVPYRPPNKRHPNGCLLFFCFTRGLLRAPPLWGRRFTSEARPRPGGGGRTKEKEAPKGRVFAKTRSREREISAQSIVQFAPPGAEHSAVLLREPPARAGNPRKFYQRRIAAFPRGGVPGSFEESIVQKSIRQLGWRILFCTLSHAVGQRSSVSLFEIQGGDVRRFSSGKWCFLGGETKDNKQRRSIPTMRFLILPLQTPERFFQNRLHSCRVLQTDTVVNKGYFL